MFKQVNRIVVTGANGYLANCFLRLDEVSQAQTLLTARKAGDLLGRECLCTAEGLNTRVEERIKEFSPTHIFHFAALSSPARCESDPLTAEVANLEYTRQLVELADAVGARLIFTSTDLVFEGVTAPQGGFLEEDSTSPVSVYATLKARAEKEVIDRLEDAAVVRLSLLLGGQYGEKGGPLSWMLEAFRNGRELTLFFDEWRTPIWVEDAAKILYQIGINSDCGLFHLGGPERVSRVELGEIIASSYKFDRGLIRPDSRLSLSSPPARAEDVSLNCSFVRDLTGISPLSPSEAIRAIYNQQK